MAPAREWRFLIPPCTSADSCWNLSAEIAAEVRHPVLKRTIRELRDALPPGQAVRKTVVGGQPSNLG